MNGFRVASVSEGCDEAKKYFVQGFKEYDKRGNPVYIYHPNIPRTYVISNNSILVMARPQHIEHSEGSADGLKVRSSL